jgi:hypothetical protein
MQSELLHSENLKQVAGPWAFYLCTEFVTVRMPAVDGRLCLLVRHAISWLAESGLYALHCATWLWARWPAEFELPEAALSGSSQIEVRMERGPGHGYFFHA